MNDESSLPSSPPSTSASSRPSGEIRFSWPPPGLEGIQGFLWPTTGTMAIGSLILVFPLLWSVGRPIPFYSVGPFGDTWWILLITSLVGLLLLFTGLGNLFRFFRTSRKAVRLGISPRTLLLTAADHDGDMGFLLQGVRAFQALDEGARGRLARARVLGAVFYLVAALWVSFGFFLSIVLASRGALGPEGIWLLTLGPVGALLVCGLGIRAYQVGVRWKGTGGTGRDPWDGAELQTSVGQWISVGEEAGSAEPGAEEGKGGRMWMGAAGVLVLAALIAVPAFALTLTNMVGPVLASIVVPSFNRTQEKAATVEVYRRYRLAADPSVTPMEAGEALVNLGSVGGWDEASIAKPPARRYEEPFPPDDPENPLGITPREWSEKLFPKVAEGLTAEERAFLDNVAAHPALDEFEVMALAPGADFLGAQFVLPFPPGMTLFELPIPKISRIRTAAQSMVARAVVQYLEGNPEGAEETLREVISAGFLMRDEGPTLIENLVGVVLIGTGGMALETFFRASAQDEKADELLWGRTVSEQAVTLASSFRGQAGLESQLRMIPPAVTGSEEMIRGLRWELFGLLNGLAPCMNGHKVVFGPDQDMADFRREARAVLVRYPSEAALFDLAVGGWFGIPEETSGLNWLGRVVDLTLGGSGTPGSCASMLSQIQW